MRMPVFNGRFLAAKIVTLKKIKAERQGRARTIVFGGLHET